MNLENFPHTAEYPEIVVSGSFRKHMEKIGEVLEQFEDADITVLAPATKETIDPNKEFIILTTDNPNTPPHKLEINFMREIRKANFLYVANIGGYVGQSVATEMAYARLKKLPIVLAEAINNFSTEIPEEAQECLIRAVSDILPIQDISKEKIENLKQKIAGLEITDLSDMERSVLQSLVKKLLKDLKSLPV